ncbi:MAG: DNA mismatch repair protein MutS [bacterium]
MSELTPMMKQYLETKKKVGDAILFFRLGDFYEMFGDDAKLASKVMQIALTSRSSGDGRQVKIPMCGIPFHAANSYIYKLITAGYKVAICEQVEDPKDAKGLVKREVVKVITPGTVLEESALDRKTNNYIMSVCIDKQIAGMAFLDITTGEFFCQEIEYKGNYDLIIDEIEKIQPTELLLPDNYADDKIITRNLIDRVKAGTHRVYVNMYSGWNYQKDVSTEKLKEHFGVINLDGFGIEAKDTVIGAAGSLIAYIYETQKTVLYHISKLVLRSRHDLLYIDAVSLRNLEVTESSVKADDTTLFGVLDHTLTSMGSRELKKWLINPLTDISKIIERQDIIQFFYDYSETRENLKEVLKEISDIERITGKLGSQTANGRDLNALKKGLENAARAGEVIKSSSNSLLIKNFMFNSQVLKDMCLLISNSIVEEPPISIKEGGIIRPAYDKELAALKNVSSDGKDWIASLQEDERKRSGIGSLKVGYTSVFGYYIEISKANLKNIPENYIRKQTLVNAERFVTPELKEYESKILGAQDKIMALEYKIFSEIREKLSANIAALQDASSRLASLDCLLALTTAAINGNYIRPIIDNSEQIDIEEGRHPVIERSLGYNEFISNDTKLDTKDNMIMVITGPNMAGKSTYMRQTAIIIIMAQAGSFIPAKRARIGVVDKIFTRVGASDHLARGQSTFMVEMIETANILNNATSKSLILLDEVGRGTSTFDGVSIAWAITEYIHSHVKAKTLFATHYYELTELAENLKGVKNYNIQVKEWGDKIIFLRKIIKGSTDRSYGIHVAQLAGLPGLVIERANQILSDLEKANYTKDGKPKIGADNATEAPQLDLFSSNDSRLKIEVEKIDLDTITPVEALLKLKELKDKYL